MKENFVFYPHWKPNEIGRPVSLGFYWMMITILLLCGIVTLIPAASAELVVDFDANTTIGYAPLAVQFNDLSTGDIVTGSWGVWGGSENIIYNQTVGPVHVFTVPGSYHVNHSMTDDLNNTLILTKFYYINVTPNGENISVSFIGGGIFGDNPVEIIDQTTGAIVFTGNTSSRNISIAALGAYIVHTERGGWSDFINSPDYTLVQGMKLVRENFFGAVILGFIVGLLILGSLFRKTGE